MLLRADAAVSKPSYPVGFNFEKFNVGKPAFWAIAKELQMESNQCLRCRAPSPNDHDAGTPSFQVRVILPDIPWASSAAQSLLLFFKRKRVPRDWWRMRNQRHFPSSRWMFQQIREVCHR